MQKEAILEKSRAENQSFDEREHQELRNSFGFGGAMICCICLLFSAIEAIRGGHFFGYGTIIFSYLAGLWLWHHYFFLSCRGSLGISIGLQRRKKPWL